MDLPRYRVNYCKLTLRHHVVNDYSALRVALPDNPVTELPHLFNFTLKAAPNVWRETTTHFPFGSRFTNQLFINRLMINALAEPPNDYAEYFKLLMRTKYCLMS